MNEQTRKLIIFYSSNIPMEKRLDKLLKFFGKKEYNEFDRAFHKENSRISGFREKVESYKGDSSRDQVIRALTYINKFKEDNDSKQDFIFFIMLTLFNKWSKIEQKHFEEVSQKLINWKDFFFSYTRNKNIGAEALNNRHSELIKLFCFSLNETSPEWKKENLLADAIVTEITMASGIQGFYDKWDIKSGDHIIDLVDRYCNTTFCMIQLIQEGLLAQDPNDNWAYYEYKQFCESMKKCSIENRLHYIVSAKKIEDIKPSLLHNHYDNWYNDISGIAHIKIHSQHKFENIKKEIKSIGDRICKVKEQWIHNIPDQ